MDPLATMLDRPDISVFFNKRTEDVSRLLLSHANLGLGHRYDFSLGKKTREEFHREMAQLNAETKRLLHEHLMLINNRRTLEQDVEAGYHALRIRYPTIPPDSTYFLSLAYESAIEAASVPLPSRALIRAKQRRFWKTVGTYLKAIVIGEYPKAFCHFLGLWTSVKNVKVAPIVPQNLQGDALAYLFGVKEVALEAPNNGIMLSPEFKWAFQSGRMVIVPVSPSREPLMRWKFAFVKRTRLSGVQKDVGFRRTELPFLSDNRPAERYLYFRFVLTYLKAKKEGNIRWTNKVETGQISWSCPGEYLEERTIRFVAKKITGYELPYSLWERNTFQSDDLPGCSVAMLTVLISDGIAEMKRLDEMDCPNVDPDDDDSNEEFPDGGQGLLC